MKLGIIAVVAAVALAANVWFWVHVFQQTTPGVPSRTEEADEIEGLCRPYMQTEAEVSCKDAIKIALAATPGTIQKISIGSPLFPDPSLRFWLIDIQLANPSFDETFQREVAFLRVGVPLADVSIGLYKEPLDI